MASKVITERDVRDWLKKLWGRDRPSLTWVEHSLGSTAGAPDVFIPLRGVGVVGVELKVGVAKEARPGKGFKIDMVVRPEQKIWHLDKADCDINTFFIVGVMFEDDVKLLLLPARVALKEEVVVRGIRALDWGKEATRDMLQYCMYDIASEWPMHFGACLIDKKGG